MDESIKIEATLLHVNVCQALADPKRIVILYLLADGPHNVTEIAEALDLPQSTVSRHLKILRERSLVHTERDAQATHLLTGRHAYHPGTRPDARDGHEILREQGRVAQSIDVALNRDA